MPESSLPPPPKASGKPGPVGSKGGAGVVRGPERGGLLGLLGRIKAAGREVSAVARGKLLDQAVGPEETESHQDDSGEAAEKSDWKVTMMHAAAERLRGAADSYIAAKLDEIEARVDAKLNHVEGRIDGKMVELHRQLREMRDRELRHRLRLLKITLIFTVVVALLSLGYKWVADYFFG